MHIRAASLALLIAFQLLLTTGYAQPVTQVDADRLFDFAESFDTELFSPPAQTQTTSVAGSEWFLRVFSNTGLILAVNADGNGPSFFAGDVYALGGPFGSDPVLVDKLANLLAFIDTLTADEDGDGVLDTQDQCSGTPSGVPVDDNGCSASQLGVVVTLEDAEKLFNFAESLDPLAFSPPTATATVNEQGSDWFVRSYANSGIAIKVNVNGVTAFLAGNVYVVGGPFGNQEVLIDTLANLVAYIDSLGPADADDDGVADEFDQCPATPAGETVDDQGCSASQLGPLSVVFERVTSADGPAPGIPDFTFAGHLTPPVINDSGAVAFISPTRRTSPFTRSFGMWAGMPGALELVAVAGDPAPGTSGAGFAGFSQLNLADDGTVAFLATLTGDGIGLLNNTGLWTGLPGAATLTARLGDDAPDMDADVVFAPGTLVVPSLVPAFSNTGSLAFNSHIAGPGVDNFNRSGIWAGQPSTLTLVARANDPLPQFGDGIAYAGIDGPGATNSTAATPPRINDLGDVAFATTLAGSAFSSYPTAHGVVFGQPDDLQLVARTGDPVPGMPGSVFGGGFGQPGINNSGDMVFWSYVDFAPPMVLLAGQPGALQIIATQGQPAPGQTGYGLFSKTVINAQGDVAFNAGPQLFTNAGGEMRLVARAGAPAPGAGDGVIFDQALNTQFAFEMNSHGQIVFMAYLSGPDIDTGALSLWWWEAGRLTMIVRDGQQVDLDPDPEVELLREVTLEHVRIGASGGQDGELSWFNDQGEVVFIMNTTDIAVRGGIFIARMVQSGE